MQFLNNLDLNKNQLLNVRAQYLSSPPSSPLEGMFYYNSTNKDFLVYSNGGWKSALYVLPAATASTLGGIKADSTTKIGKVEVKMGEDEKLYVPAYPYIELKAFQTTEPTSGNSPYYNTATKKVYNWDGSVNRWIESERQDVIYRWDFGYYKFTAGKGLTPIGDIPTKTSDLENDSDFTTQAYVDGKLVLKVDKTRTIAGVDLQNNITKEELKIALDIDNIETNIGETEADISALETANMIKSITRSGSNLFTITYYDDTTSSLLTLSELKSFIGEATQSLSGLMTAQDKVDLDTLMALFDDDADSVVNTIAEVLSIFDQYPEGADLVTALEGKVDKVTGKGLSTNDYTTADMEKLAGIGTGAERNVQSDWEQETTTADDYIKNKPYIPGKYIKEITLSANNTISVTHGLGTKDVIVSLRNSSDEFVYCDVTATTANQIQIKTANIGAVTTLQVTVIG